ncbi:hypothetical protein [Methanogenium cariaci]|uniref:hypothetical protein n=1 Tax=Methanogenium cariaci TaxID=2197 RepID=UPI0007850446|nr:hypothetical protein [Methanogenium cariaci]
MAPVLHLFSREKTEAALYTIMKLVLSVCVSIILSLVVVVAGIGAGIPPDGHFDCRRGGRKTYL